MMITSPPTQDSEDGNIKPGLENTERKTFMFNHRLKNIFFTAARNYTLYNPDSHLTGYYRSLKARGMKQIELYKRVARALLRRFYKDLKTTEHRVGKNEARGPIRNLTPGKEKHPEANPMPRRMNNNYIALFQEGRKYKTIPIQ
jgi:hypothetical protein